MLPGTWFRAEDGNGDRRDGPLSLSYYTNAAVSNTLTGQIAGKYHLAVDLKVNEKFVDNVFDYNKCRFTLKVDGKEFLRNEYSWQGGKPYHYEFDQNWVAGDHNLVFELQPLTQEAHARTLTMQITAVTVRGPLDKDHLARPKNYDRFFPKEVPAGASARRQYAGNCSEILRDGHSAGPWTTRRSIAWLGWRSRSIRSRVKHSRQA